jgi:hypothetical protein
MRNVEKFRPENQGKLVIESKKRFPMEFEDPQGHLDPSVLDHGNIGILCL